MISLLVPYRSDSGGSRARLWEWTQRYWRYALPDAEIVMGHDEGVPFSKTTAVNEAAARARGDVFVILDSDCYYSADYVRAGAALLRARKTPWLVPYHGFYRLNQAATEALMTKDPAQPFMLTDGKVEPTQLEAISVDGAKYGHLYGAMITMMPREAFECVGGMDPRFRGWGSEDICFLLALDTLWGKHSLLPHNTYHLYHDRVGADFRTRKWEGQDVYQPCHKLASRYRAASGDLVRMRALVEEWQ